MRPSSCMACYKTNGSGPFSGFHISWIMYHEGCARNKPMSLAFHGHYPRWCLLHTPKANTHNSCQMFSSSSLQNFVPKSLQIYPQLKLCWSSTGLTSSLTWYTFLWESLPDLPLSVGPGNGFFQLFRGLQPLSEQPFLPLCLWRASSDVPTAPTLARHPVFIDCSQTGNF